MKFLTPTQKQTKGKERSSGLKIKNLQKIKEKE
jgi:hypothetical protein